MTRKNNFDFLRLLFASFVIIEHSASLSNIHPPIQFPVSTAKLGVYGFFIISGYLVTGSFERSGSQRLFLLKRIRRIFPGLVLMGTIVATIIGFLLSTDVGSYFSSEQTMLHYLSTITLAPFYKCLPGIFQNNPAGCAVNGSLWTIRYEILFYILLSCLFFVYPSKRKSAVLLIFVVAICSLFTWLIFRSNITQQLNYHIGRLLNLSVYFFYGAVLYLFPNLKNRNAYQLALILFVSVIILHSNDLENILFPLIYPLIVINFGSSFTPFLQIPKKIGDVSYGMYIYAYPIQQALIQLYSPSNLVIFTIISLLISVSFGFTSWHLIEKRFLFRNGPTQFLNNRPALQK